MTHDDPTAGLLIIDDELLCGRVVDQNGPFLIAGLYARGVRVTQLRMVADQVDSIADAVRSLGASCDRVLSTGGIGPTHDDVTLAAVAQGCGRKLQPHPDVASLWGPRPDGTTAPTLCLPQGARLHRAPAGLRPIVPVVQVDNIYILPGVPALVRRAFTALDIWGRGRAFCSQQLQLAVDELAVATLLAAVQQQHPTVAIGSYPQAPGAAAMVILTLSGRDPQAVADCQRALRAALPAAALLPAEQQG